MKNLYPLFRLHDSILFIHKGDLPHIGRGDRALDVKSIEVSLKTRYIDDIRGLEVRLKFDPWEEIVDKEYREIILRHLNTLFSNEDIQTRIVDPLEQNCLK